ncbi:DUF2264 domain-containing protein [Geminisphaera colitermitum]|uniref:DUF2264 domain-containing protein n=1 Tax=Geminisphaera colitermitum TaxID=1148786 RepID=UPI000158CBEE|nr:DUF2264 domain-containing protein [Geminisphaera colitermitum]
MPSSSPASAPLASPRLYWETTLSRVATPVLEALAQGRLRASMPIECIQGHTTSRATVTHLEAFGRTLAGLAPWMELQPQHRLAVLAREAMTQAVDPRSPDRLNFTEGGQPLVDAAFLAHALLRAPRALWHDLDEITRQRLAEALRSTRVTTPGFNNWLLFSAMIEAALLRFTDEADFMRIDYAVRQHEQWYLGDGVYGDGPEFHWDFYNSFVIQPMLLDVLETAAPHLRAPAAWRELLPRVRARAVRYAAVLERLIAPDGSFPPVGRSIAYRCGAFQLLAQMALRRELPEGVAPAQVRGALTAVIRRTLGAPGTFDNDTGNDGAGWLRIGLAGHQPGLGEVYISTGSLYLCTTAFLPLGLPASDDFWSQPDAPWTSARVWAGADQPVDKALK